MTRRVYRDLGCYFPFAETCLSIYKHKVIYYFAIANCCTYTLAGIGLVLYGFTTCHENFWLEGGLPIFIIVLYNTHIAMSLIYYKKWANFKQDFATTFSWNLDDFAKNCKMRIIQISLENELSTKVIALATTLITIWVEIDFVSSFKDMLLYLGCTEPFTLFILACFLVHLVYMSLTSVMATFYSFYFLWLCRIQQIVLYSLAKEFQKQVLQNSNDNFVKQGLKKLIKRHQTIKRTCKQNSRLLRISTSMTMFLCIAFFVLLVVSPYHSSMQGIFGFISVILLIFYFSHEGQNTEHEAEMFHMLLYELNWYAWNTSNRKLFLTFFMNSADLTKETGSELFQINHMHFKKIVKMAYALLSLLRTITSE